MNTPQYDAIVIGAGHNGLSAAATLARKGKTVCVIERNPTVGGMARNTSMAEGVQAPEIAHLLYNLNGKVAKELGIGSDALPLKTKKLPTISLASDGQHVVIEGGNIRFADGRPHPEAQTYAALQSRLEKFANLLGQMSTSSPPSLDGGMASLATMGEMAGLAKLGLDLKRMGKKDMREFLRVLLSNAYDLILDDLEDTPLAGAMAADAVRGSYAGPRSPGTVFTLMYRLGNDGGKALLPIGGMGSVSAAFADSASRSGAEIRTGTGVKRVLIEEDRATGVELDDGTILTAHAVLSNASPKPTMMMAGPEHFDVEAVRRLRNLRCKGTTAKVNLLLSAAPEFPGLTAEQSAGRLLVSLSATYAERAFNPAKYGGMPENPLIEAIIPSLTDPGLTVDGQHVLSAVVSCIPHDLKGGWDDAAREKLAQLTIDTLDKYAPGIGELVTAKQVLSPADIEDITGANGGHWHHAEMGIDQILTVRPANQLAHYRFGPTGYYLCGAGAHPGGDVMGAAGRNAAIQLLKDGVLT